MPVQWGLIADMPAKIGGSFQEGQRNALAMQAGQQEQQMNALKLQQAEQEMGNQNALREAYRTSGGDMGKLQEALKAQGMYEPAMKIQKGLSDQQKADMEAKKAELEGHAKRIEYTAQVLSSSHDQASHDANLAQLAQDVGEENIQNVPKVFNPQELQFIIKKGMTVKDQAYQQMRAIDQAQRQQQLSQTATYQQAQLGLGQQAEQRQQHEVQRKEYEAGQPKPMSEFQQYQLGAKQEEKALKAEEALANIDDTISDFKSLKDIQEKTTTGPVAGSAPVAAIRKALPNVISGGEDLQRLEKGYNELAVKAIGAFKAGGVTFGAMSEKEGQWVKDTQSSLTTGKEINKEMLDKGIKLLEDRKRRIQKGITPKQTTQEDEGANDPEYQKYLRGE
ncbi:MAG: hypothetical protein WC685_14970 [Methylobacter sp.]|jgi:hypothetical protein